MAILHLLYGAILLLALVSFALMVLGRGGEIFAGFAVGVEMPLWLRPLVESSPLMTVLVVAALYGIFASLFITIAIGLWKLRAWARILTICLWSSGALVEALAMLFLSATVEEKIVRSLLIGFFALVAAYFFQPGVKQAFSPEQAL